MNSNLLFPQVNLRNHYTTGIMTNGKVYAILEYRKKQQQSMVSACKAETKNFVGRKDMNTMNRFASPKNERRDLLALLKKYEWSFDFVHSFKAGDKRKNCVFYTA